MPSVDDSLSELIARLQAGRSLQKLSDDCGGVPSKSRLWQMTSKDLVDWPGPDMVRGLAKGLGVSESAVIYASANSLGFRMQEPSRLASLLPESAADLDDTQVHAVLAVVAAMNPGNAARD